MDFQIPDKLYFKIGEVADLTGIKPYVLRYWESEFAYFRPTKSRGKQRLYRRKDIELVLRLKDLLYNQGFTIAGARKKLRDLSAEEASQLLAVGQERRILEELRNDLRRLRKSLDTYP
ncbi:MAG: MerR family transcriptional regulator [Firmicutes bacterium ML8_F2]|jgi:DNA-binding transcriptional MerR regulator|nr:MAG: MerR family transcriptional regulator [Firmicutes bacterium ML8_F2]